MSQKVWEGWHKVESALWGIKRETPFSPPTFLPYVIVILKNGTVNSHKLGQKHVTQVSNLTQNYVTFKKTSC